MHLRYEGKSTGLILNLSYLSAPVEISGPGAVIEISDDDASALIGQNPRMFTIVSESPSVSKDPDAPPPAPDLSEELNGMKRPELIQMYRDLGGKFVPKMTNSDLETAILELMEK